ncbi:MAG TPA: carboxypeptidase-like regulatory domain-containing protein [Bacteroidetes bacterium]|nr:carboxypeptidase-like regulatory domain-containing protein [Bacteroidota bacterium]
MKVFLTSYILFLFIYSLNAQDNKNKEPFAVQFSGVVVTQDDITGEAIPLPYTNIYVKRTSRGTVSGLDGFFSIVALRGDTIKFSFVGYKPVEYVIPDTLNSHFYSVYQIMSRDDVLLPETVIYPWPRKQYFKQELLTMDISDELKRQAEENLAEKLIKEMIKEVPFDGREAVSLELNKMANDAVYTGQIKPMRIFDIMAWRKFIKAWKRGDFKRKKKD